MEWPRDFSSMTWPNNGSVKIDGGSDYLVSFKLDQLQSQKDKKQAPR